MSFKVVNEKVYHCTCERCKHNWRTLKLPKSCSKCKSRSWNIPKRKA